MWGILKSEYIYIYKGYKYTKIGRNFYMSQ